MDFGSNSFTIAAATTASDDDAAVTAAERHKQEKWYGSGLPKQGRSGTSPEDELRGLKTAKIASFDDFSSSKAMQRSSCSSSSLLRSCNNFFSEGGQQMLSFSSPKSQTVTLPFYYHAPSSNSYLKNTAYDNGGLYGGSILAGVKGPFTPSQWMELEHQALIYKYIDANARVPTYLLNPIRKALDSAGFASFVGLRPVTYGWSGYNLGYSNNTDPEPGRCRRTDGKKWRCSREAVADHKYCERHMNRGRHRSRKPVEGQSGHSISGTKDTSSAKQQQPIVSSPLAAAVVPGGGASNSLSLPTHNQLKSSFPCAPSQTSAPAPVNRTCLDKEDPSERYQDFTGLSMISSPSLSLKGNQYSFPEQSSFQESRKEEFGQVCSGSLLNPFNESSSLLDSNTYVTSEDLRHCKNTESDNGLRQLFVDWPSRQSEQTWPEIDPASSERTQLSISIPIPMAAASDFMSSTSSPTIEKVLSSPLRLSRDLEKTTQMGLAVGTTNDQSHREEANWIPISWESSMGGPLGEVLHNTNNNNSGGEAMIPSALNLMTEGWDGSPYVATSPTGHLHKSTFVSLSNSSAGSSPRAETSPALRSTLINSALPGV